MSHVLMPSVDGTQTALRRSALSPLTWAFTIGATVGGALLGSAVGVASAPLDDRVAVLAAAALLALIALSYPAGLSHSWPERRRQVPVLWLTDGRSNTRIAFSYGAILGSALWTYIKTPLVWGVVGIQVGCCSIATASLIGGFYGLTRGLSLIPTTQELHGSPRVRLAFGRLRAGVQRVSPGLAAVAALTVAFGGWR